VARLRAAKNIVRFVDAKDPSTGNHSETVSALAAAIGAEMGLDPDDDPLTAPIPTRTATAIQVKS